MKKKLLSVMLASTMTAALLAGCGSATETDSAQQSDAQTSAETTAESTTDDAQAAGETETGINPIKIGIVMYQWTDSQGENIQNFCSYLSDHMDVTFEYESTYYDDDAQLSCVENLISKGCDAIISGYDTNIIAALSTCEEAGVYYAVALDQITEEDLSGMTSEFFVGGTRQFGGDLAALGEEYADAVAESGVTHIGGISFPAWAFSDAPEIYTGFQNKLTAAGIIVDDLTFSSGMTADEVQQNTKDLVNATEGMDAIFGMSSGLDYVYPEIQGSGMKLIAMGYDTSVASLMESGDLLACGNNNHTQAIASCVARLINAKDGNSYPDSAEGTYNEGSIVNGVAGYPVIKDAEDLANYQNYIIPADGANGCVTVDELLNCVISVNPNATLADLNALTNRSLADVVAAHN